VLDRDQVEPWGTGGSSEILRGGYFRNTAFLFPTEAPHRKKKKHRRQERSSSRLRLVQGRRRSASCWHRDALKGAVPHTATKATAAAAMKAKCAPALALPNKNGDGDGRPVRVKRWQLLLGLGSAR
jgi:hypothetical protein